MAAIQSLRDNAMRTSLSSISFDDFNLLTTLERKNKIFTYFLLNSSGFRSVLVTQLNVDRIHSVSSCEQQYPI